MGSAVSNLIIIIILVIVLFFSVKNSITHFKGKGACCGGGGSDVKVRPRKLDEVIAVKVMKIEGMHCEHCYSRVHNTLNSIEGVNATVKGKKGEALIKLGKEIPDRELLQAVNDLGYKATEIRDK
ncbi:MAG: cation transporter [Lachnospiraceae bacterium]|nr:cation transporter [Lachnospiraceae bacterium]